MLRRSSWTPFDRPRDLDDEVYLVADDPRKFGRVWREAECETTDRETVLTDLLGSQYGSPDRVVRFNTAEAWSPDATAELAAELRRRCDLQFCRTARLPAGFSRSVRSDRAPAASVTVAPDLAMKLKR